MSRTTLDHARRHKVVPVTLIVTTLAAMLPTVAAAHAGDAAAHGLVDGFVHPFLGLDHLAAMLAVGLWSAWTAPAAGRRWLAPLAFVGFMIVGAVTAAVGIALPAIELMIAASLLLLGGLLAGRVRLTTGATVTMVGGLALFHGAAHGAELAGSGVGVAIVGMAIGTLLLHAIGVAAGVQLRRSTVWQPRVAGLALAGLGLVQALPALIAG